MKRMLVNANDSEECRIAIVEDGKLSELYVEISDRESYLGNIYKGKVVNIEPSIVRPSSTLAATETASCTPATSFRPMPTLTSA
jgi:hypothetical protein